MIAPAIALPSLSRGNVIVNGLSRAFADDGDTNPAGPSIVLDGRYVLLTGLALASDRNQVYGLNLQRFVFAGLNVMGHDNVIAANYIGTDPTASEPRWNAQFGIQINNGSGNRIGLPGLGNVIGGNAAVGVLLTGNASSNNVVHDNSIGTDPTGTRALGNGGPGIVVMGAAPSGNVIGGLLSGEGNRIAFNHGEGIYVGSSGERGTSIRGNAIYFNDELGIDLAAAGVTENDELDADAGANRLQNYPVITFATLGEQLRVAGTFHSALLRQYSLDFYASDEVDPSGYGEGQRHVGSVVVVTDAAGEARFDEYLPGEPGAAEWITATATDVLLGDTSEFSLAHTVRDVTGLCIVTNTYDSGPGSLRAAIECANSVTTDGPANIEFAIPVTDAGFLDVDSDLAGGDPAPDVFVVTPLSPLPALTRGGIVLDGQSQHGLTGDTNPFGPEIVLAGHVAGPAANGIELRSAENHIHGLNIQGFGGDGIFTSGNGNTVTGNYIGTDPTGNSASQSAPDLLSLWSAEGNADDFTDNNHGTLVNGTSFAPGRSGQAFQFDGVNDYVATPLVVDYTAGVTFELWVSTLGDGGNTLMAGGGGATRDRGMGLFLEGGRPALIGTKGTAGIPNFVLHPNLSITDGQFHHLVGTWTGDTTPDGVKLYLDGQLVGSTTAQTSVATDGTPLYLGDHPAYYLPFRGLIDEPAVYGRVLSEGEVAARFRTGGPATSNGGSGVRIDHGDGNRIGGTLVADRNVISANGRYGVRIEGNSVAWPGPGDPPIYTDNPDQFRFVGNSVLGNILGLAADGSSALGNGGSVVGAGVFVVNSSNNQISDNTVSGNRGDGVAIQGGHTNHIENNQIGLTADGTASVGNTGRGILVSQGSQRNEVIGNVVSGNLRNGIAVEGPSNRAQTEEFGSLLNTFFNSWTGYGNEQHRDNYGYSLTNFTQGTPGGEAGGTFARASSALGETVEYDSYYADTDVGRLTLKDPLQASGELIFTALNNFNGSVEIGYLNTVSAQADQSRNILSLRVLEPSPHQGTTGIRVLAEIALADGTRVFGTAVNAGPGLELNVPYTWELNYDPVSGANNQGRLEVRIFAAGTLVGTSVASLTAAHRSIGASFDAFGLLNGAQSVLSNNPNTITLYVDNLRYTHQAVGHTIQGNFIGTDKLGTSALPNAADGLVLTNAAPTQVGGTEAGQGNVISGNSGSGIEITGGSHHLLQGNFIGTTADGMRPLGNSQNGVLVEDSSLNLIGGVTPEARNVIGGNFTGISIVGTEAGSNRVQGNYIGIARDGRTRLANSFGVALVGYSGAGGGVYDNAIGGATEGERNIISGNSYENVLMAGTIRTVVQGNWIGPDVDGAATPDHMRSLYGVRVVGNDRDSTIGGTASGAGNVISGHSYGIRLEGSAVPQGMTRTRIQGNRIGTAVDGRKALPNEFGVYLLGYVDSDGFTRYVDEVTIGGTDPGARNLISGNDTHGVLIVGPGVTRSQVQGNQIGTDIDGQRALPNLGDGVLIEDANDVLVGGSEENARNIISGNQNAGIVITGLRATDNRVLGNYIGTDVSGLVGLGNAKEGIRVTSGASGSRITGNVISANSLSGVSIEDAGTTNISVHGNYIGTDKNGVAKLPNTDGVFVGLYATGNQIGGTSESEQNVISGNNRFGVVLASSFSDPTQRNLVQGNYIGTDRTGMLALGNLTAGIALVSDHSAVIGGAEPGAGNVISGNGPYGIWMYGGNGNKGTRIQGNLIGTTADQSAALPNWRGIEINGAGGNFAENVLIGGTQAGVGNVISGNSILGVQVIGPAASGIVIQGNTIGTTRDGTAARPNAQHGVLLEDARGVMIGGTDASAANVIADNGQDGVAVIGSGALGNTIRRNAIYSNAGLGIDLGDDGVTPNDNGDLATGVVPDLDLGPNMLQNFPELQNVQPGLETRVTGQLRSTPDQSFVLDFYAGAAADPTGFGEGQRWLGSTTVVANEEGVAGFNVRLAATTYGGEFVTATATRLRGDGSESDTSEFSAALAIKAGKGVRGPNSFTLELVPDANGDPSGQRFTTFDVELIGALDASDVFTPIDVAAFTTTISHSPLGPVGLPVSLATDATSNSPLLMDAVIRGTTFAQVVLVGQSTIDGIPYEFARWTLDDVRLGSFATRDFARDEFTLVYDRLAYVYKPLNEFGAPARRSKACGM